MARQRRSAPRHGKKGINPLPVLLILILIIAAAVAVWFLVRSGVFSGGEENTPGSETSQQEPVSQAEPTPTPAPTPTPTPEPTPTPTPTPTPEPTPPPIYDDGTEGYLSSGICIYDNKAFELFYGSEGPATDYADVISYAAGQLAGTGAQLYSMVVPNHSEFGMPERVRNYYGCGSQRENLTTIYSNLPDSVMPVDVYDILNLHNDEPIYYNTDTHWASLGAYYAYTVFAEKAGVNVAPLESFEKSSFPGFLGYLEYVCGESCLSENPDTIDVYDPKIESESAVSYDGWEFYELDSMNGHDGSMGYSMFFHGDNGCVRVRNLDADNHRRLVMTKDSYGNAMGPFLAASFEEVHLIDFRYFTRNLTEYVTENGITDVLFFNNAMSANTYDRQQEIYDLFD